MASPERGLLARLDARVALRATGLASPGRPGDAAVDHLQGVR